jgi:hypothetical protein
LLILFRHGPYRKTFPLLLYYSNVRSHRRGPHRKHQYSVAIYGLLLSKDCCIFSYLAVVAYQGPACQNILISH